jgi:gliding motility-associated-like protein
VSYIATNTFGCEDTSSVTVFVYDEFEFVIPNVFTPNGDRINDEFKMVACGVYDFELSIFNRFGVEVFKSKDLDISWDGRVNGKKANPGAYFYTIRIKDFRGDYLNYSGPITIITD